MKVLSKSLQAEGKLRSKTLQQVIVTIYDIFRNSECIHSVLDR
jgi:hypothetical protein